jgi:hypothetical protein
MTAPLVGKVAAEWLEEGVWLSKAWEKFGPEAEHARQAAERFATLRGDEMPDGRFVAGEVPEMFLRSADILFSHWRQALPRLHGEAHKAFVAYAASRQAAEDFVLVRLMDGGLVGFGNRRGSANDEWIPTPHWNDFALSPDPERRDIARGDDGVEWRRVRVVTAPMGKAASTAAAEQRLEDWLVDQMVANPHKTRTNADLFREAREFDVSERAFRRAKLRAIERTGAMDWSNPGAKSKR